MAGQYTLNGNFKLIEEAQGTLYNVGTSNVELSSDATKGQGILLRSGETQSFKGTIYARSYDDSGVVNVQNFIELPGGGDGGGGGGGGSTYTLPTMSQAVKGGAKLGPGLSMTGEVLSLDSIYIPSAVVSQTATGAILTVSDHSGTTTASIKSGADGEDGETPTISTDSIEGGNSVTFGTSAGFWTVNIYNGTDGAAGVSPTVAAESIEGGNSVTFTSAAGMATINIMDGTPGANGVGVTMTTDSIEGGTALKMHSASGFVTVNVYNGKDGAAGADGKSFEIKAQYPTEAALIAAHPTGSAGDAYLVGDDTNPDLYIWLSDDEAWQNSGPIAGIVGPQGPKGDDGVSARVAISSIVGGNRVTFTDGAGAQTMDIFNGVNGVSPSVSVATITGGHSVTFTDATTTNIINILDGTQGEDGDSVSFALETVTGGNRVTLTDANGSSSFTVYNGRDGADGASLTATVDTIAGGHVVSITGGSTAAAFNVMDGVDGENGVSPICGFTTTTGGNVFTVSDVNGSKSITILDGEEGTPGFSPVCGFTTVPAGHIFTVTDAQGTESILIKDGSGVDEDGFVLYDTVGMITWQHTLRRGCLICDGSTVTASEYPELTKFVVDNNLTVSAAGYATNPVMYVYDSGNDTLTLPDLLDLTPQGVHDSPRYIEAGLPEISGAAGIETWVSSSGVVFTDVARDMSGSFFSGTSRGTLRLNNVNVVSDNSVSNHLLGFSASRSDSIYGGSNTVQPPAAGLIPQVRYESEMLSELVPTYRKNSQAYAIGDIAYTTKLPSWARLECVVAGTTNSTEPSFAGASVGDYISDGTAKWIVEDTRNGHMVGEVFTDTILRPGCVKALGATANNASTNYPRILAYLTENPTMAASDATDKAANPYKWLYDSQNDTLTMPDYTDRFVEGGAAAGVKAAGLPNITGKMAKENLFGANPVGTASGAFKYDASGAGYCNNGNAYGWAHIAFDASLSDSLYGGSTTVQPSAIVNVPQFKY